MEPCHEILELIDYGLYNHGILSYHLLYNAKPSADDRFLYSGIQFGKYLISNDVERDSTGLVITT